jgi:hypothetical protein
VGVGMAMRVDEVPWSGWVTEKAAYHRRWDGQDRSINPYVIAEIPAGAPLAVGVRREGGNEHWWGVALTSWQQVGGDVTVRRLDGGMVSGRKGVVWLVTGAGRAGCTCAQRAGTSTQRRLGAHLECSLDVGTVLHESTRRSILVTARRDVQRSHPLRSSGGRQLAYRQGVVGAARAGVAARS